MLYQNAHRFTDPAVLQRLSAIEQSSEHQQTLAKIKSQMQENRSKRTTYMVMLVITLIAISRVIAGQNGKTHGVVLLVLVIATVFLVRYFKRQRNRLSDRIEQTYIDSFLLPVIRESFPDTEIDYNSGIDKELLLPATPHSSYYSSNCHITFGDDYKTEFCNLYAYHVRKDSDDNETTVTDFLGQVYVAHCQTELMGHVRIVPTQKTFFGREVQIGYDKAHWDERKIELEDIAFNETHNVYCTDEMSARRLLNPYLIALLDDWAKKVPVAVYMTADMLVVSFYSDEVLLRIPKTRAEIDELSLTGEYRKVQDGLGNTYRLIDMIVQQV